MAAALHQHNVQSMFAVTNTFRAGSTSGAVRKEEVASGASRGRDPVKANFAATNLRQPLHFLHISTSKDTA
jgi:hypothetical protein